MATPKAQEPKTADVQTQTLESFVQQQAPIKKKYELRSVYGKTQGRIRVCPGKDRTGRLVGVDRLSPEAQRSAEHVVTEDYQRELWDGIVLDENNVVDAIDWKWLKELPEIAQSQEDASMEPRCLFYVHDEDAIAERDVKKQNAIYLALKAINESTTTVQRQIMRLMGNVTMGMSDAQVVAALGEEVMGKDPARNKVQAMKIVDAKEELEKGDGKAKLAALEMIDFRIIIQNEGGYYYRNISLGTNLGSVVRYMSNPDNQSVAAELIAQLKKAKG